MARTYQSPLQGAPPEARLPRKPMRLLLATLTFALVGCEPIYPDSIAPSDAKFAVSCAQGCGAQGEDQGIAIDVSFAKGTYGRQLAFCCEDRAAVVAQLTTAADWWCDGLEVPAKKVGGLTIATNVSPTTGQRGVTIDGGEGYVSFNCDAWLPKLIADLRATTCCPGH